MPANSDNREQDPDVAPYPISGFHADPHLMFDNWFEDASRAEPRDPNAMTLATTHTGGGANARTVLMKEHSPPGFVFYTNLDSLKSQEIQADSKVCLLFYWKSVSRQVRILGPVSPVADRKADEYFSGRPRDSQIGAWASRQSSPLSDLNDLQSSISEVRNRFDGKPVERPSFWSGYCVTPTSFEFWEERPNRLHSRLRFTQQGSSDVEKCWSRELLYP